MKKQERRQRYDQIREMYEPVVRAKNYAMRQMIETGKKMGKLRHLMLAVLFIFLFTYHFFFAIFTQLKMREKLARVFSMVMVVVLVFTSVDVTVFAATWNEQNGKDYSIVSVETPSDDLLTQKLPVGAKEDQIRFPETLTVTVVDNTAPVATATPEVTEQPTVTEAPATEAPETTDAPEATEAPDVTEAPAEETPSGETPAESENSAAEPDVASESDAAPASENEAEPVEQNVEEEQPAGEVSRAGQILSDTMDLLFPAMKVYAAESTVTGETRELPVTWELVAERSSRDIFAAENAGEYYTYQPVFSEDYALADGMELPVITVRIQETDVAFDQSATVDGITVTVSAEEGVFPEGATLQVERITAGEQLDTITNEVSQAQAEENEAKRDEATAGRLYDTEIYAFDITILNAQGEEIQPDTSKGEVKVRFSNLPMENAEGDTQQMFCMDEEQNVELLDTLTDAEDKTTETQAEHFTVYGVALSTQAAGNGNVTVDSDNNKSAEDLVGKLIASDEVFTATDAKRNGTVRTFSDAKDILGIDSGIVLDTSGSVAGTNDAQLDQLRDSAYRYGGHTSSLEFTMQANGDMLCFNYVFASQEFNQSPMFNDVFGLFVKVNNGSWQNIAKITRDNGTEVPVNIVNLRAGKSGTEMDNGASTNLAGSHSLFNATSTPIGYSYVNGISDVFTALLPVTPGDTVTLKFAICDISDTVMDSFVFIEGNSLSFKGPKKTLSYTDANGVQQTIEAEEGETVTAPEAPSKDGYFFTGRNTRENGSGETYQPGDEFPLTENTKLYPMWEQIKNTARVDLQLDDTVWGGQQVQLWKNGSPKYTLSEKSDGIYQNAQVVNGSYDVYVNGRKTDKSFTFAAKKSALSATQEVTYRTLRVETILDGSASSIPGAVTLRQNQSVVYTPEGQNGIYEYKVLTSESAYDIFVDGMDTGFTVSNTDPQKTIDYYTAQVTITDDAA